MQREVAITCQWRSSQNISGWMILFITTIRSVLLGTISLLEWIERFQEGRSVNTTNNYATFKYISDLLYIPFSLHSAWCWLVWLTIVISIQTFELIWPHHVNFYSVKGQILIHAGVHYEWTDGHYKSIAQWTKNINATFCKSQMHVLQKIFLDKCLIDMYILFSPLILFSGHIFSIILLKNAQKISTRLSKIKSCMKLFS